MNISDWTSILTLTMTLTMTKQKKTFFSVECEASDVGWIKQIVTEVTSNVDMPLTRLVWRSGFSRGRICYLQMSCSDLTTWQGTRIIVSAMAVGGHALLHFALFLAATKQLYEWYFPSVRLSVCPSVCLSVCPSHLFDYVPIIVSSWNFQELSLRARVRSMQKVKVRGQRSRSQRSRPNLTVSGL